MTMIGTNALGIANTATTVVVAGGFIKGIAAAEAVATALCTASIFAAGAILSGPVGWSLMVGGGTASEVVEPIIQPTGEVPFGDSFEI